MEYVITAYLIAALLFGILMTYVGYNYFKAKREYLNVKFSSQKNLARKGN